jgi:hypothetical protein
MGKKLNQNRLKIMKVLKIIKIPFLKEMRRKKDRLFRKETLEKKISVWLEKMKMMRFKERAVWMGYLKRQNLLLQNLSQDLFIIYHHKISVIPV